jgi:GcrA cell cycle regulator
MGWTEERVAILRKLWNEGHSASMIAKELGQVTRNAVIGKVHRLGLSGRATPSRPVKRPPRAPKAKALPPRETATVININQQIEAKVEPQTPAGQDLARTALGTKVGVTGLREGMCKWPVGDPQEAGFGFCGAKAAAGVYCSQHAAIAYQPVAARKQKNDADRALLARLARSAG